MKKNLLFMYNLKHQSTNTLVMTTASYGANYIGEQYHNNNFSNNNVLNKLTQLTLHATLGAISNELMGNDGVSGAVSGVIGEIVSNSIFNSLNENSDVLTQQQFNNNRNIAVEYGGLASAFSSLIVGKLQNLDDKDIVNNIYNGYRIGKNAGEYNSTNVKPLIDKDGNIVKDKYIVVEAKKDGDTSIYDITNNNEKIGETLFDDDYINREGNIINFDTKIGNALGINGLYGDNAEEMVGALIFFEGDRTYPYYDTKGLLTIGIGLNINNENIFLNTKLLDLNSNELDYSQKKDLYDSKSNNFMIDPIYKYQSVYNHLRNSEKELINEFGDNYSNAPTSAKMGLINMTYNMGMANFKKKFPILFGEVKSQETNWNKVGNESNINNIQQSRNDWNKNMLQNGENNKSNIINYVYKDYAKD